MTNSEQLEKDRELLERFNSSVKNKYIFNPVELLAAQERLIKEEYRKKLQKIIDCDDDCIKGYQCFYDHHKLKKELNQIINHD